MNHRPETSSTPGSGLPTRRRFLQAAGAVAALAAGGGAVIGGVGRHRSTTSPAAERAAASLAADTPGGPTTGSSAPGRLMPGAVEGRILVVVELKGGNDGLSTLSPIDDPLLSRLRPSLAPDPDELLALDDEVGLHPSLARLHSRGITTVEGVGPVDGDLSHFAMTERWERGDVSGAGGLRTGFLGRLADAVDDGSPLVGLSLAGNTPHLLAERAATMSLGGPDDLWFLEPNDWYQAAAYRAGITKLAGRASGVGRSGVGPSDRLRGVAGDSYGQLLDLASDLAEIEADEVDWSDPLLADGGSLGAGLYLATDLIAADLGVRVIYAADDGDYDTHSDHPWRQADNLARVDAAIDGFLRRADDLGFGDRVLVATVSEFGRRAAENDGGLDHGSASTMLVAGPVGDRRLGDRPPLDDLDDDGNLRVTVGFDRYLAGLAESWLGVEAASVLPDQPTPVDLV